MAPFLFLIYAEVKSTFVRSEMKGIKSLSVPNAEESLVDSEFANDTIIYVKGMEVNLYRIEQALTTFCLGSRARLNWSKSVAFWVVNQGFQIGDRTHSFGGFLKVKQVDI